MRTVGRRDVHLLTGACVLVCLAAAGAPPYAVEYPGEVPGDAEAELGDDQVVLRNQVIESTWRLDEKTLGLGQVVDLASGGRVHATGREAFAVVVTDGRSLRGGDFRIEGEPGLTKLEGDPSARRLAERFAGWRVTVPLASADGAIKAEFSVTLRDESNYVIQCLTLAPVGDLPVEELVMIDFDAAQAEVAGGTQGAPVAAGTLFFACEHPMAQGRIDGGHVTCSLKRAAVLEGGSALTQTAVIGVTPAGQLRRGFLYYVERERAHPYRPFLHYNSWYDIAWGDRKFDEAQSLAAIQTFGEELVTKRGVSMDSFVFDDGWDDNRTLWQFHDGFPNGFRPLHEAAAKYGSAVGTWLSPFGGYGEARNRRLEYGRQEGFETNRKGFSLAGPRYYGRFRAICEEMIREYGVNFFKFDGMGMGGEAATSGGGEFLGDIEALMRLVAELRALAPELYVSATTGTWCSPYFLWHADSTWRGAGDMGFHGRGSKRQQWITYRDLFTYRNVVQPGPLYPLNSLMTQGIAHGRHGHAAELGADLEEMADEVWSFFGSGTGLQELYVAPQLLDGAQWDMLAEAARWARANADVFVDTHWVGGDPGAGEVYGFASWTPRKGLLVLRNPSDAPGTISIDIGRAFELPGGVPETYRLTTPRPRAQQERAELVLSSGKPHAFRLDPFQVLVLDAVPE